jgi:uncharacterized membrane protein
MERIEKEIEVRAPLGAVYDQWTQFEEFPLFMAGVKEVRQLDDRRLYWRAEILGKEVEWEAEIFEQIPDTRIAWRSTSGHPNSGTVSFVPAKDGNTKVTVVVEYQPIGIAEKVADALGAISLRIGGDLKRFRDFMEDGGGGGAVGGWRGEIREGLPT